MNKPDWETHGRRRRRSNTLEALRPRVGDDVIAEAHRWIADWELAVNGYCDEMKNSGSPAIPGNVFTFNVLRGQKWLPIRAFCRHAGQATHMLLVQMLAHGWSFSSIGRSHWPELQERRQRQKAAEACESALLALHDFWCQQRRAEAVHYFRQGKTELYLDDDAVRQMAERKQADNMVVDAWEEPIRNWLEQRGSLVDEGVTIHEVLAHGVGVANERMTMAQQRRAGDVLRALGLAKKDKRIRGNQKEKRWFKQES